MNDALLIPDWPAPPGVRALVTTRTCEEGRSAAPYARFNLAAHVGESAATVFANRQRLHRAPFDVPAEPLWLTQVHGTRVVAAEDAAADVEADASVTHTSGRVCAVLTADCLPLLFCAEDGSSVAAAHAGWRGLACGVIENTVAAQRSEPERLLVWLGPAIGPAAFEVGAEVRAAFIARDSRAVAAFVSHGPNKWLCDLYLLARQRLSALGVTRVYGGGLCTFADAQRFYSYRRDGVTGRMASLIWIDPPRS
jgi:YfiH family protein